MSYTRAQAEIMSDTSVLKALKRAEKKHGILTGVRLSDAGQHIVSVSFHPDIQFWIEDYDVNLGMLNRRKLTTEEYEKTWALRL